MTETFTVRPGQPYPLGSTFDGTGTNFAIFSEAATKVELCLVDPRGKETRVELKEVHAHVWHAYLPEVGPGQAYGYRVHGEYAPERGLRCDPSKLLVDPYARAFQGEFDGDASLYSYDIHAEPAGTGRNEDDSLGHTMLSVVINPFFDWQGDHRPNVPDEEAVIYETHVKGMTMTHPDIPEAMRGTYAGMGHPAMIDYLKDLGITTVELMPVHQFLQDDRLRNIGLRNYWGYNTFGFFAPQADYAMANKPGEIVAEFKSMVRSLHAAGLEVILDVVYNHTAEGNELGPTISFKGIDNASYYRLMPDQKRYYINDTGTGNTVNTSHPRVMQMVMDSLRYWAGEMRVDGFRFDLATILAREPTGFSEESSFLHACMQDPLLSQVKLIAEPWDCGPGGYQVGRFPPGWAEWNDGYRDTIRAYWKGDEGMVPKVAGKISASADLFDNRGRKPWASVNFVTAHDGFTLHDLVCYNDKHNDANGEDNRDGHSHNLSYNYGHEGPSDDEELTSLRFRQLRNFFATLLFSRGTPMILAGDEFARTQGGNNNAYAQDNEIGWIDWDVTDEGRDLAQFVQKLIRVRQALPMLRRGRFLHGEYDEELGVKDVAWLTPAGVEFEDANWADDSTRCFGVLVDGRARSDGIRRIGTDATMLIIMNSYEDVVNFKLPEAPGGVCWHAVIDTNQPDMDDLPAFEFGSEYMVTGRSLMVFLLEPEEGGETTRDWERSFTYVSEAFIKAAADRVRFALVDKRQQG